MQHGLEISCGGDGVELADLVRLGITAERAGWDAVFFEDYLVHYAGHDPPTFDPWMLLAAIAVQTSIIRLGTTVTALPRRHPLKLAREALTLDHLSGGRATLAVGLGDPADRGTSHVCGPQGPMPRRERAERTDEGLDVVLGLLGGSAVHHAGPHYRVNGVTLRPGALQPPRVPVWVGGSSQAAAVLSRAARADGIVPYKLTDTDEWSDFTPDEVAGLRAATDARRASARADAAFDIAIGGRRRRADETVERHYLAGIADAGATWWLEFVPAGSREQMHAMVARGPLR